MSNVTFVRKKQNGTHVKRGSKSLARLPDIDLDKLTSHVKTKAHGRSKLTPDRQDRLVEAIRQGNYYDAAAGYAGIDPATLSDWLRRGKQELESGEAESPHARLYALVKQAEQEAEVALVAQWRSQTPDDWKAVATFLERRHPEKWGRRDRTTLEHTGKGGQPLAIEHRFSVVQQVLSSPEQRESIAAQWRDELEDQPRIRRISPESGEDE